MYTKSPYQRPVDSLIQLLIHQLRSGIDLNQMHFKVIVQQEVISEQFVRVVIGMLSHLAIRLPHGFVGAQNTLDYHILDLGPNVVHVVALIAKFV